jgi:hypothetical protein
VAGVGQRFQPIGARGEPRTTRNTPKVSPQGNAKLAKKLFLHAAPWSLSQEQVKDLIALLLNSLCEDRAGEIKTESGVAVQWDELATHFTGREFLVEC